MKRFLYVCLAIFLSNAAWADPNDYSEKDKLKNWALSHCLGKGLKSVDAVDTASGFLEFGHADIEAYEAIDKLSDTYLAKIYGSYENKSQLNTMKCIDLFYSHALDVLVRKYTVAAKK